MIYEKRRERETRQEKQRTAETKRTSGLVVHHTGKVLDAKLGLVTVFRRDIVGVELVLRVELVQHRSISSLE